MKKHCIMALVASVVVMGTIAWSMREKLVELGGTPIIGRVEYASIHKHDMVFKSRIDTGAGVSSINATIEKVEKIGDREMVTFKVEDEMGNTKHLKLPVEEWINIKDKGKKGFVKRPAVIMDICVGGRMITGRVNLADRSQFLYPMLIGRNILKGGHFIIDPRQRFMKSSDCPAR